MADNKIVKMIDEMSDFVDSHNAGPLSRDKIKISKDELLNYIDNLRQTLPNELEEAYKITKAKNEILKAASNKAAQIEEDARNQLKELVKEDSVVIEADKEAERILRQADDDADAIIKEAEEMAAQIKIGALSYAEEMLAAVEKMVSHNLKMTIDSSNSVIDTLKSNLEIVKNNRDELNAQILEAREVNGYSSDDDGTDGNSENEEGEFTVNVESGDFEEEDSDDDARARDEYDEDDEFEEEDEEEELVDLSDRFSFKKKNK